MKIGKEKNEREKKMRERESGAEDGEKSDAGGFCEKKRKN